MQRASASSAVDGRQVHITMSIVIVVTIVVGIALATRTTGL